MQQSQIKSLTGLRGVAAVWVVLFHMSQGTTWPIVRSGWLGVDVFFILSGLVLSHVYTHSFETKGLAAFSAFFFARVGRIFPLHLMMLFIVGIIFLTVPGLAERYPSPEARFSGSCFVASAFLIQNWFHWLPGCWNAPAWSLSAEWLAYLTFPLFFFTTQRWQRPATCLALAVLSLSLFDGVLAFKGAENVGVQGVPGLLRMAFEFAAGCLIYRALRKGLRPLSPVADGIAIFGLFAALLIPRLEFMAIFPIALVLILAAQNRGGPIATFLSNPTVFRVGEISYSIYLIHWILLQLLNLVAEKEHLTGARYAVGVAIVAVTILALSELSYRYVELRTRKWIKTFATPRTARLNADAI